MARGPAVKIILGDSARSELEMRARRRKIARVDAVRAEIVLLAADGMNNCAIAATLGLSRLTAGLWRKRFAKKRFDGLDMALMTSRAAARRARSVTRRSPKS
jgi:transposase